MWAKKVCLALSLLLAGPALAQAQTGRITGTVVDSANSQPIATARVSVVGTTLATATDADGRFSLSNVGSGAQQIRVQRIGFTPVTRAITVGAGATSQINIAMRPQAVQLSTVVSVGYGTQRLSDVAFSDDCDVTPCRALQRRHRRAGIDAILRASTFQGTPQETSGVCIASTYWVDHLNTILLSRPP